MEKTIGDIIGEDEAKQYAQKVMNVWEIEQMHNELIGVDEAEKDSRLKTLDEAAGYFRAIAAHLRISR